MEGACPKYFINYSPTISQLKYTILCYVSKKYSSTISKNIPQLFPTKLKWLHSSLTYVQVAIERFIWTNILGILDFILSLSIQYPCWASVLQGTPGCLPRQTIGFVVCRCTVSSVNQQQCRTYMASPRFVGTISNKIWSSDFGRRFGLKRLLKW